VTTFRCSECEPRLAARSLLEDNVRVGAEPIAILTYDFWTSRFGRDRNIVGATIHLNGPL
jgi:putative ABC transport system permease protein